ncbi:AntB [Microscilla marina ATCC 23134]|uniref:AntB n=1 Tax=Microscilla marina ATCC 23134 TaxID=313606 RepID=A1ZIS0_MICM2|nr:AntB [Microscilla marina ATCC 23134]
MSVECAKAFTMLAQTDKGREVRKHFIECEKKYNARNEALSPAQMLLIQAQQMVDFESKL